MSNHEGGWTVVLRERQQEAERIEALEGVLTAASSVSRALDINEVRPGAALALETLRNALARYDRVVAEQILQTTRATMRYS